MRKRSVIVLTLLATIGIAVGWSARSHIHAGYALINIEKLYPEFDLKEVPMGARVAAFVAHGDDECFLMAGTLVRLKRERKAHVTLVLMSDDRHEQFRASTALLGLDQPLFMEGLGDLAMADPSSIDASVAAVLDQLNPDVVIGFGPEGITGHPDHKASGLSVWRSSLRRGTPLLLRMVMPSEFAPLVATYAHAPEPGWGIGSVERVPLGEAGELRSASASCYPGERSVLERNEWHANLVNAEFFEVTRQRGPANAPRLINSRDSRLAGVQVLVVVHPTESWDLQRLAKPNIDKLVERFEGEGWPVAVLVNDLYPFTYLASRRSSPAFNSSGGEHALSIETTRLWFAGGSWASCLDRGIRCSIRSAVESGARSLEVVLPSDAIYVVHFDEERAVTLREEAATIDGGAMVMLEELVQRLLKKDMTYYPAQASLPSLAKPLEGWSIQLVSDDGSREFRAGTAGELVIRVLDS